MKNGKMFAKTVWSIILSVTLSAGTMAGAAFSKDLSMESKAATTQCTTYPGSNQGDQNYFFNWSIPIKSYLHPVSKDCFMRVQANAVENAYLIEYYDTEFNIQSTKRVPMELELFGGFYATDSNYYILSGQKNLEESADVECYRITKYDKDWNRINSAGLFDCNTTTPFRAGTPRFAECGKYLLIRTDHEMYAKADGSIHQANVTIQLDTEAMKITDKFTHVLNKAYGYISHSFNQFIHVEDNKIIAVDHGDANPRSIVLIQYPTDVSSGKFTPSSGGCKTIDLLTFPGEKGNNVTGATVGGFEISDTSYLTAYNSVDQENGELTDKTKNIFIAVCDKATSKVTTKQITNFAEGEATTSTPQFVKISDNEFMLLWERNETVFYVKVDGTGNLAGEIQESKNSHLSDCVPVAANNQLTWYVWDENVNTFYSIDLTDTTRCEKTVIENGHEYKYIYPEAGSNICKVECIHGDYSREMTVPTDIITYWNDNGGTMYYSAINEQRNVGDTLWCWTRNSGNSVDNEEMEIRVSDENVASVSKETAQTAKITCLKAGTFTVYCSPTYNPNLVKTATFTVTDPNATPAPTPTVTEEETPTPTETETPVPTGKPEVKEDVTDVFDDVYEDWYTDYVQYVYDNNLMTGIKGTRHFAPDNNITKAQVAQVLYNMEGQPALDNVSVFTELKDVYDVEWYAAAVAWAYGNHIVTGDLNTKEFSPNADVTREQLALMIYRYAKHKGYDVSASSDFADLANADKVADWSMEGMKWAVGEGLISGAEVNGVKDLDPQGNASRAQVAAILQRFCENVRVQQ